ncbi:hypothetical protein ACS0TY_034302 [Phlomoides rotata]
MIERMPNQIRKFNRLVRGHHLDCLDNLRVNRRAFGRLCVIVRNYGGLVDGKHVLWKNNGKRLILHKKNRVVKYTYNRFGQTVSHYVHLVLTAVLYQNTLVYKETLATFAQYLAFQSAASFHIQAWEAIQGRFERRPNSTRFLMGECPDHIYKSLKTARKRHRQG